MSHYLFLLPIPVACTKITYIYSLLYFIDQSTHESVQHNAISEILPALKDDSPWRQYLEYRFTDTTTSFLAGEEERFSKFEGMTFGGFEMERSGESQGYELDWDFVVVSNVMLQASFIVAITDYIKQSTRLAIDIIPLRNVDGARYHRYIFLLETR
jgi:hypothetical protein